MNKNRIGGVAEQGERAIDREALGTKWKRVRANKGAAGIDGVDIDQTAVHPRTAWPVIRGQLLSGKYRPLPVRRVNG